MLHSVLDTTEDQTCETRKKEENNDSQCLIGGEEQSMTFLYFLKPRIDINNTESLIQNALRASKEFQGENNDPEVSFAKDLEGKLRKENTEAIYNNSETFYETTNVMKFGPYSPSSKIQTNLIEKSFEGKELIIKTWTKLIKQMNTNCFAYTKSVESFASQLLTDKDSFEKDKEISNLLTLISQSLKDYAVYTEMFAKVVENSIYR